MPEPPEIKCLALVRGQTPELVKTAICDLDRFAHLVITGTPKQCDPVFADHILISVMEKPLKKCCNFAAVVALDEKPVNAICRLQKIHPPAHVIVISPKYGVFKCLLDNMDVMPEMDLTFAKNGGNDEPERNKD